MKLLMVSLDRKIFIEGNSARARLAGYGTVFEEVHVIVYSLRTHGLSQQRLAENVWAYPTSSPSKLSYVFDAIKIGKSLRGHFSIVSGQDPAETGIAAWRIARTCGVSLQLQDHADIFDPWFARESIGNRARVLVARFLLPRATCVRAVLPRVRDRLLARIPSLQGRVSVLPVFVDTTRIAMAEPAFDLHARYPQFERIALVASRLVPQKDIRLALRAFARANVRGLGMVLMGEGRERAALEQEAARLGIGTRVVFAPWEEDLASAYKTADLFLLSSRYESYCRTLVEASAAGLPFVATDVGVASILAETGAGVVVPVGSEEEFSRALMQDYARTAGNLAPVDRLAGATEEEYRIRFRALFDACTTSNSGAPRSNP